MRRAIEYALLLLGGMLVAAGAIAAEVPQGTVGSVTDAAALAIVQTRCAECHSDHPTLVTAPPKRLTLTDIGNLDKHAAGILHQAVQMRAMPPGNVTHMSESERSTLSVWLLAHLRSEKQDD
jgi:uncharacterized membrane protein